MIPVMALDVSLRATGYACNIITPTGRDQRRWGLITPPKGMRGAARLDNLARQIVHHVRASEARLVAIENYAYGAKGSAVTKLPELGGCIRRDLYRLGVPYIEVPSNCIKAHATGRGNADKNTMVEAAQTRHGYRGHDDNIADAIHLHALVADALGLGYTAELPAPTGRQKARQAVATVVPLLPRAGVLTTPTPLERR